MLWLIPLLLALPAVREVTPPDGGGWYTFWTADYRVCAGGSSLGPWIWSEQTGPVRLTVFGASASWRLSEFAEVGDELILVFCWDVAWRHVAILRLPRDPQSWFPAADLDHDGDVDMVDFGLWQRRDMPAEVLLSQMGGPNL